MNARATLHRAGLVGLALLITARVCLADERECFGQLDPGRGLAISRAALVLRYRSNDGSSLRIPA